MKYKNNERKEIWHCFEISERLYDLLMPIVAFGIGISVVLTIKYLIG